MWTEEELAERWRTSVDMVQRMCRDGRLRGAYKVGREWRVTGEAVIAHEHPVDPFGSKPFTGPLAHGSVAS